ncbi:hypothetical protein vseg_000024 [Gypsophila vaccaria]
MGATPKRNTPTKRRTSSSSSSRKRKTTATLHHNHHTATLSPLISAVSSAVSAAVSAAHTFLLTHDTLLLPPHTLSLHSSLSSVSLSLSNLLPPPPPPSPTPPPSSTAAGCWFERFVLSSISDDDPRWSHIFRMSKPTFSLLTKLLSNSLTVSLPPSISPHFALGCGLYKLAHDVSFPFVGSRFGFSSGDACRTFYTVCKVICDELGDYVCGFGSELGAILSGFHRISMSNCCGVLGFGRFGVVGSELLKKDGFLIVQALVDSDGRFLDISAGWPSTFSPLSILRQTRLFLGVEESKELLNGPEIELFDGNLVPQYVLGDCCYPCLPWLITPFAREGEGLSHSEVEFNKAHSGAMRLVKAAFGRVRANWKLVNRRWKEEFVEFLPFVITTACVLNNFLMKHGEMLPDGDVGSCEQVEDMPVYEEEVDESAAKIRDLLAMHLSRVSRGRDD